MAHTIVGVRAHFQSVVGREHVQPAAADNHRRGFRRRVGAAAAVSVAEAVAHRRVFAGGHGHRPVNAGLRRRCPARAATR